MSVLTNVGLWVDKYDLRADFNQVDPTDDFDELPKTTFASGGFKEFEAGYSRASVTGQCFFGANSVNTAGVHDRFRALWKQASVPISIVPLGATEGNDAMTLLTMESSLQMQGQVGQFWMLSLKAGGTGSLLIHGKLLGTGAKSSSGNGSASQLGAVSATQRLYASLHATAVAGGNLTVKVQSDDAAGFTTPSDRLTFAVLNAPGAEWKELAGPITDTYWRVSWTLSAGTATLAVVVGIR